MTKKPSLFKQMQPMGVDDTIWLEVDDTPHAQALQRQIGTRARYPVALRERVYTTARYTGVSLASGESEQLLKITRTA